MRGAGVFEPRAERPFRLLWAAATTSAIGSAFVPVALAFAVLGIGGTATSLGLVLLTGTIAGLLAFLAGGVWADRLSRRNLMLSADIVRLVVEALVAVLLLTRHAHIWELGAAFAITEVASSFFGPASTALVPEFVAAGRLQKANSLLSISQSGSSVVGPALSGLLVAMAGAGWAFAVDAASFAGSAVFLLCLPALAKARPDARQGFFADLATGWHEVTGRTWAWATLIGNTIGNMAFSVVFVLGPVLALQRLGGASAWGLVGSGFSAGAVLGALAAVWVKARRPIADGMLATVVCALPPLALAARLPLYALVVSAVIAMAGGIFLNTNWDTAIQQLIPNEVLGRFRSYDYLLAFMAMPVGLGIAGPLAGAFGAGKVLTIAGAVIVVCAVVPPVLPAVRAVVRHEDGTITGPPAAVTRARGEQEA
ncbi:MAG TPA: MFS transporter [Streptosporangiaceae bacterium]|nr:MFS transporter [Streptosporangiaceae bacterium]